MTGLADCNNFFVSCERTLHPELNGKAVVVLSNNDGCAIARSNEAKRLGVAMGQPAFELRDLVRSGKLVALSGHHTLYHDISVRVHEIFRRFVPDVIDYSVDEAFLDFHGMPHSVLPGIAAEIVGACRREAGIPVTVGMAPTKTLAKIATAQGKKSGREVCWHFTAEEMRPLMDTLSIAELWGIGRRLARRLYLDGILTIGKFYDCSPGLVRGKLGINGEKSWHELHGRNCITLSHVSTTMQQSVSQTRTFPCDVNDFDYLRTRIAIYASECSRRLRDMHGICRMVSVFLRANRFRKESAFSRPAIDLRLSRPTSDTHTIADAAVRGLVEIYNPAVMYKRAGVVLSEIGRPDIIQPSLFDADLEVEEIRSSQGLMSVIDSINGMALNPVVRLASQVTAGVAGKNDGYSSSFGFDK